MSDQPNRPEYDFDFHGAGLDAIFDDYAQMHERCPVSWSNRYGGFWSLATYDDVHAAEHDPETYSVAPSMILPSFGTDRPLIPLDIDPPDLTPYRKTLLPFFTPQRMDALLPRTHELAQQLLDDVAGKPVFDASVFSRMLPTMVFSEYCGFPVEDAAQFDVWVELIVFARTENESVARQAANDVYDYFRNLIALRRREPGPDVISGLLASNFEGRPLTDDEMLDMVYLLFVAGLETTASTIRSGLWYLAQNAEALAQLVADPAGIPRATEEILRTLSPVQAMARTLKQDTTVRGVEMKAGERVTLVFGSRTQPPHLVRYRRPSLPRLEPCAPRGERGAGRAAASLPEI
jgi:cytochrome P450